MSSVCASPVSSPISWSCLDRFWETNKISQYFCLDKLTTPVLSSQSGVKIDKFQNAWELLYPVNAVPAHSNKFPPAWCSCCPRDIWKWSFPKISVNFEIIKCHKKILDPITSIIHYKLHQNFVLIPFLMANDPRTHCRSEVQGKHKLSIVNNEMHIERD